MQPHGSASRCRCIDGELHLQLHLDAALHCVYPGVWTLTLRGLDHVNYPNLASGGGVSHGPLRPTIMVNYHSQPSQGGV